MVTIVAVTQILLVIVARPLYFVLVLKSAISLGYLGIGFLDFYA